MTREEAARRIVEAGVAPDHLSGDAATEYALELLADHEAELAAPEPIEGVAPIVEPAPALSLAEIVEMIIGDDKDAEAFVRSARGGDDTRPLAERMMKKATLATDKPKGPIQ